MTGQSSTPLTILFKKHKVEELPPERGGTASQTCPPLQPLECPEKLYRDDEPDCSEICQCGEGEVLACNTICVERAACKTDFAFYNHAAPAYQAYRGRCLCYSGRFICMRPAPGSYKLPQGVFLFLGYSEADEKLLLPLIRMEVQDAVLSLQMLIKKSIKPKFHCNLSLYSLSKENIILVAKLAEVNSSLARNLQHQSNTNLLRREKEECVGALQDFSEKVNSRHPVVHSHLLLSIFKMAEVEVVVPASSSSSPIIVKHMLNIAVVVYLLSIQQYCAVHLIS
ncbi:uncharacterized protein LOC124369386 [Homalodisca vitripennis]|uniref:uncharacterized protein LOC124369386 n=1 Tax=Homalodisca vitripennis TaxID=197043 RepID=UPI001EEBEAD8|nr:uncharacterized protein LOC124369386 [Homalodisca vitripennis]